MSFLSYTLLNSSAWESCLHYFKTPGWGPALVALTAWESPTLLVSTQIVRTLRSTAWYISYLATCD